jgi:hypothetical protein
MTKHYFTIVGAVGTVASVVFGATLITTASAQSKDGDREESRIQQGFAINPVPLNVAGKNRALVGLGSYIVNGSAFCDGCHNPGPGNNSWLPGGNPFFGQPAIVNPAGYMGGGRSMPQGGVNIVARNLTPDKDGLPAGHTFEEFRLIMRTGVDFDRVHPTCSGTPVPGCIQPPFDGDVLQMMPWPYYQYLTDYELRAIYEYLTTIPCIEGPPPPNLLHNDCP